MTDRSLSAAKAYKEGKSFEEIFKSTCLSKGMAASRIQDGCIKVGAGGGPPRLIAKEQMCDFILSYETLTALIETKNYDEKRFGYAHIDQDKVDQLLMHERQGTLAGIVIFFRKVGKIVFFRASQVKQCEPGSSLDPMYGRSLGTLMEFDPRLIFEDP